MDRRTFLLSAAAAGIASPAVANMACYQGPMPFQQTCDVGVIIGNFPTPWQECKLWCWAACVETAVELRGYSVNQQMMAAKLFGDPYVCQPATGRQIKSVVDGNWQDLNGQQFQAQLNFVIEAESGIYYHDPLGVVWQELSAGRPLLFGSLGHATLITAMNYTQAPGFPPQINSITLRDPWPYTQNKRVMTTQEFNGTRLLATFSIS